MVLAIFTVFSASSITHGFVSYYTASRCSSAASWVLLAYDDRWFGEVVQRLTASNVREIFIPNPPTMALMALPLVGLDAAAGADGLARGVVAAVPRGRGGARKYQATSNREIVAPVLWLMLLSPAVFTNLRIGQGYLIVFALFAATAVLLLRDRARLAGVCLGLLLALKTERRCARAHPDRSAPLDRARVRRLAQRWFWRSRSRRSSTCRCGGSFRRRSRHSWRGRQARSPPTRPRLASFAPLVRRRSAVESVSGRQLRPDRVHCADADHCRRDHRDRRVSASRRSRSKPGLPPPPPCRSCRFRR